MTEISTWLTENFNNRELAGSVWLIAFLLYYSFLNEMREGFGSTLQKVCAPKLLTVFGAFAANVAILAWLGLLLGFWEAGLLTATIFWYFFGGLPLFKRSFDAKEDTQHFGGYVKDAFSFTVIVEFLYNVKTFSFYVELFLVLMVMLLVMAVAFSEPQKKYAMTNAFFSIMLAIVVLGGFSYSVWQILNEPDTFFTKKTLCAFLLPIYFTVLSTPFFYFLHCYSRIEGDLIRIDLKAFQSDEVKAYAKKRFFLIFLLRPCLFQRAVRQFHILPARDKEDVDKIINDILKYERAAKAPPSVDPSTGWSPFLARDFLAEEGMRTGDYHHQGYNSNEWWSGVTYKKLGGGDSPNKVNFSFSGVAELVTQLKLRGRFMDDSFTKVALEEFSRLSQLLIERTVADADSEDVMEKLRTRQAFKANFGNTTVELSQERLPNGKGFELVLDVAISADPAGKLEA